jgi:hypothetical protein
MMNRMLRGIAGTLVFAAASLTVSIPAPQAADRQVRWRMANAVSSSVPVLGTTAKEITKKVEAISGGSFKIDFYEPGALVPPLGMFDAVSHGSVDVALAPPSFWAGKIKAAALFAGVPFGPSATELMAWVYHGSGQELWREILELHRLKGELLLALPDPDPTAAEACYQQVARDQGARLWELRAAASLARLWRDQGRHVEAHDLLAPVYGWFTEGFDTADLKEQGAARGAGMSRPAV